MIFKFNTCAKRLSLGNDIPDSSAAAVTIKFPIPAEIKKICLDDKYQESSEYATKEGILESSSK